MGLAFSEEVSDGALPTTGKAIVVKVQCSHNGKSIAFAEHKGYRVTSDWTTSHLQEAIEVLAGVHRHCQRLMFGGRSMEPGVKVISMLGCEQNAVPDRIKLFLIVDRYRFPQTLGPFNAVSVPLQAKDFDMPEMTEDLRRTGFYWDMDAGILEGRGLHARSKRITGQVSPTHPVTVGSIQARMSGVPKEAKDFVWSYPVAGWEGVESDAYALDRWEGGLNGGAAVKSFFSVGGYMYFDADGQIAGLTTLSRLQDAEVGNLHFAEPRRWLPEWSAALFEQGRFQKITLKAFNEAGARMYLWLRPNEVIEASDGNPLPVQPEVPHGGFVYLFHDDILSTNEIDSALDRYFPVMPTPATSSSSAMEHAGIQNAAFRCLTLVDRPGFGPNGEPLGEDSDSGSGDDFSPSFQMATPAATPASLFSGTPSTAASSTWNRFMKTPEAPPSKGFPDFSNSPPPLRLPLQSGSASVGDACDAGGGHGAQR